RTAVRAVFSMRTPEVRTAGRQRIRQAQRGTATISWRNAFTVEHLVRETGVKGNLEHVRQRAHAAARRVLDEQRQRLLLDGDPGADDRLENLRGGDLHAGNRPGDGGTQRIRTFRTLARGQGGDRCTDAQSR